MSAVLLVIAVLLCAVAAILGFGWFGTNAAIGDIVGVLSLGAACGFGSFLVGATPWPRA